MPAMAQLNLDTVKCEKGIMKDGFKVGVWEYYDEYGEIDLKIDYDKVRLLYLKPDTNEYVIKVNKGWAKMKLDVPPKYIGSICDISKVLSSINYPSNAKDNRICGSFSITFEIDTFGKAGNFSVINDLGGDFGPTALSALKKLPNYWLVAQKNGKAYVSKYIINYTLNLKIDAYYVTPRVVKNPVPTPLATLLVDFKHTFTKKTRFSGIDYSEF